MYTGSKEGQGTFKTSGILDSLFAVQNRKKFLNYSAVGPLFQETILWLGLTLSLLTEAVGLYC